MDLKLNAKQLRSHQSSAISNQYKIKAKKQKIYIILDNVLDTYNIGSIFRLADAVGAAKIYLCGGSETPPNHRIKKASVNTTEWVEWEYCETAIEAIRKLQTAYSAPHTARQNAAAESGQRKADSIQIIAVEQAENSVSYDQFDYQLPVALVVGHESDGVSKEVLEMADGIVELPMFGVNVSLNVMVSLGIVLYEVIEKTR